jgi:hypothetical protein
MSEVTVKLVFDHTGAVSSATRKLLSQVVRKTALDVQGWAQNSMTGPKHGRIYEMGNGILHQASAPGEAPARDTGNLAVGIAVKTPSELTAEVAVAAEYGRDLEFGNPEQNLAARPFLTPAVEAVRAGFNAACKAAVAKGAQEGCK